MSMIGKSLAHYKIVTKVIQGEIVGWALKRPIIIILLTTSLFITSISCSDFNRNTASLVNTYSVGGMIIGLSGTIVLQNNGGNNLTVNANSGFTFSTALNNGAAYNVTVSSQPSNQFCTVTNGSGTINSANVPTACRSCTS